MALASFSEGRLVDKVKSAALLSPIAYLSHMTTDLGLMAARAFVGEVSSTLRISNERKTKTVGTAASDNICYICNVCRSLQSLDLQNLILKGKNFQASRIIIATLAV